MGHGPCKQKPPRRSNGFAWPIAPPRHWLGWGAASASHALLTARAGPWAAPSLAPVKRLHGSHVPRDALGNPWWRPWACPKTIRATPPSCVRRAGNSFDPGSLRSKPPVPGPAPWQGAATSPRASNTRGRRKKKKRVPHPGCQQQGLGGGRVQQTRGGQCGQAPGAEAP
jgi:hypothetical protein